MVVMGSTFLSRLLGFLRIAVIGAVFGASGNADVLNLVFNIPNNLRKLLAEGALSSAFLPVLARSQVEDPSGERSRRIVRQLLGLQIVVLVPVLVLATLGAQPIVNTILAFPELERQILAADLFRFFIHYLLLISLAAVLMGTLNSHHRFLIPAVAPLLFSVAVIGSVVLLHRKLGVYSMVVGVLLGGLGQLLVQILPVRNLGYRLTPLFRFRDPHFRTILIQWLPVASTASVFAIDQQIALFFASGLADGSGSAMTNALVFWQLPFGIFSASVTTVLFPLMSRQYAAREMVGLSRTVIGGLRALAFLLIPAAVGLAVLGRPIVAVALQRGAFTFEATRMASNVLIGYCFGLFSVGAFTFLQRFFYSTGDYRTPLRVAAITMTLDIMLSLWLKETRLGVAGLSLANSVAFTVGLGMFLVALRRRLPSAPLRELSGAIARALVASGAAVLAVLVMRWLLRYHGYGAYWVSGSSFTNLGFLLVEALPAAGALVGTYRLMGISVASLVRRDASSVSEK
jgi:putative peptidoglycan lipid II flippase